MNTNRKKLPLTNRGIIDAFGGPEIVAEITQCKIRSTRGWRIAGVPSRFHNLLVKEAKARRIKGITHDVLEDAKRSVADRKKDASQKSSTA